MTSKLFFLLTSAASVSILHTLAGPDHYLPFIAMSHARAWSMTRTILIIIICGVGHVASSVIIGFIGIFVGSTIGNLTAAEEIRNNIATWMLTTFGFTYFVWGIHKLIRNRPHHHFHYHEDKAPHEHKHSHDGNHTHVHGTSFTPWILFTIFIFGPCEPLIPLLMYPATIQSTYNLIAVIAIFSAVTICTMILVVLGALRGLSLLPLRSIEKYTHVIAGAVILLCGLAFMF